jgi:NitT/TauT family transport system substrate-binding protein
MNISIAENFRAIFYAPFYALRALDLAAREGVAVEWLDPGSPGGAIDDVKLGRTDATWGGPMRVLKDHDSTPADGASLLCFGDVVTRDPFYLVGRPDAPPFSLTPAALAGQRLGVVSEVPTPWHCLRADLEDAGVDTAAMRAAGRIVTGLSMAQQMQALQEGGLDAAQVFEPYASAALAQGSAKLLYTAAARGPTVYTTFICSRDSLARCAAAFAALTRALARLQHWMVEQGPGELARVTAPFFPDVPEAHFRASIERYYRDGIWARETVVSKPGFERLAHSLHAGGFIHSRATYAACVHNFDIAGAA